MPFHPNNVGHTSNCDADRCDDQLPLISRVGRGIRGNSSYVKISDPDSCTETHLEGGYYDSADKAFHTEWISENINGGELSYQYNLRQNTIPRTFTITFIYSRPGRHEWSWTTPAIPYIWSVETEDGEVMDPPDAIVGSGVATLFVKTVHDSDWEERLNYPIDPNTGLPYDRKKFNAPEPNGAWASTITFGHGGDIDVPDFDDIAKIIGITKQDVYNILEGNPITINGINADDIIDYIDKCDKRDKDNVMDHIHADMGFNDKDHGSNAFDGYPTVKAYIDAKISNLNNIINNMKAGIGDIIYGATVDDQGNISLPEGMKVPTGNINVFSGDTTAYIRTRDGEVDNDIKAV